MTNTLAKFIDMGDFEEIKKLVNYFNDNKALPKDCDNPAKFAMKLQAGRDLGLNFSQSNAGLSIINGVVTVYGNVAAMLMKRGGYQWKILESTSKICKIQINEVANPERDPMEIDYKIEEAEYAGLLSKDNWKNYPKDMLYRKCLARARKRYCPDALNGMAVYEDYADDITSTMPTETVVIDAEEPKTIVGEIDGEQIDFTKLINEAETIEQLESLKAKIGQQGNVELNKQYANKLYSLKQQPKNDATTDATDTAEKTENNASVSE